MGFMGNPDLEHAGNECLARCISQAISLLNVWKNIFQFSPCVSLCNSSSSGNVSFLTFQQCLYEKATEVWSLTFTQGLKSCSAISCKTWNFWCQVVGLVRTLTRVCSAESPALPPHFCWSCLAPRPARHHSWQLPCPTLPWFINDTSKNALCSYSCLIPPPQTSKAAQESSHWHPLCSYFSSTPCLPLQHKAETEKRKKCLPRYCYACFVVLVSMYLLDHRPEQQGAIQMNCCHLYMSCHLAAH